MPPSQTPNTGLPGWGVHVHGPPFSKLCFRLRRLPFQAILEENKEKLPVAIDPVARPCDHIFKCVPPLHLQGPSSSVPLHHSRSQTRAHAHTHTGQHSVGPLCPGDTAVTGVAEVAFVGSQRKTREVRPEQDPRGTGFKPTLGGLGGWGA